LNTDWYKEIQKAKAKGAKRRAEHATRKVAEAMAQYEEPQRNVRRQVRENPELLAQMELFLKKRRDKLVHRGKRDEGEAVRQFPKWSAVGRQFPLEMMLVEWWVRLDNDGLPGLMFWRNAATTKFLLALTEKNRVAFKNCGRDYIKNTRKKLGLIPVGENAHIVWDISVQLGKGGWKVAGFERNGKRLFRAIFPFPKPV
jgi:hypothetical protein